MMTPGLFAVLHLAALGQSGGDLAFLEQEIYRQMQAGQWKQARRILDQRKASGSATLWLEMTEGDLCFWEGFPEEAKLHYQRAQSLTNRAEEIENLRAKTATAEQESTYRIRVHKRGALAKALGFLSILVLLGLPVFIPWLWKRKGPGFPGPR